MCVGTECTGNVEGQLLHAHKEMGMGVSGALLNSAIPANPSLGSLLFFHLCVYCYGMARMGSEKQVPNAVPTVLDIPCAPPDLCPTLSSLLSSRRLGIQALGDEGGRP